MTPRQIELGRHALGLPNKKNVSYRNYFCAGTDDNDFADWMDMVNEGTARRSGPFAVFGWQYTFFLTRNGASLCLQGAEKLDGAYFPDCRAGQ